MRARSQARAERVLLHPRLQGEHRVLTVEDDLEHVVAAIAERDADRRTREAQRDRGTRPSENRRIRFGLIEATDEMGPGGPRTATRLARTATRLSAANTGAGSGGMRRRDSFRPAGAEPKSTEQHFDRETCTHHPDHGPETRFLSPLCDQRVKRQAIRPTKS